MCVCSSAFVCVCLCVHARACFVTLSPGRFTTKPKIDKYPPAKRGMTPPKPRIHDRKQLGNTQETDDIDVKFGEMSLPTSQPGSRSQAGKLHLPFRTDREITTSSHEKVYCVPMTSKLAMHVQH